LAGLYLYAVNAFHKDSFRHVPDDVNEVHLEAAAATLTKAGEALESAGKSLKSLQVKPAGKA
jgi:hypothetical protein